MQKIFYKKKEKKIYLNTDTYHFFEGSHLKKTQILIVFFSSTNYIHLKNFTRCEDIPSRCKQTEPHFC